MKNKNTQTTKLKKKKTLKEQNKKIYKAIETIKMNEQ